MSGAGTGNQGDVVEGGRSAEALKGLFSLVI
jgi:hypothetical protein